MMAPKLSPTSSKYVTANPDFDLDSWCVKLWTNPHGDLRKRLPVETLVQMMLADASRPDTITDHLTGGDDKDVPFLVQVVIKRFQSLDQNPSQALCWLVAAMSSNPGQAVMLCISLSVMYDRRLDRDEKFNLTWFLGVLDIIDNTEWMESTWSVPSQEDMHTMWDLQKFRVPGRIGDNLLDTVTIKPDADVSEQTPA